MIWADIWDNKRGLYEAGEKLVFTVYKQKGRCSGSDVRFSRSPARWFCSARWPAGCWGWCIGCGRWCEKVITEYQILIDVDISVLDITVKIKYWRFCVKTGTLHVDGAFFFMRMGRWGDMVAWAILPPAQRAGEKSSPTRLYCIWYFVLVQTHTLTLCQLLDKI